jgi:hypothetical protein
MHILMERDIRNGPLFRDAQGKRLKAGSFEPQFFERLSQVQQTHSELLSPNIEIEEEYGISRSFWRGATSQKRQSGKHPSC